MKIEVVNNIFANPLFKIFEDMNFMERNKHLEFIELSRRIMKRLSESKKNWIVEHSDRKLREYFGE